MAFVAAATSVGAAVLGTGAAAGIGSTLVGGALIGAGIGGAYSALTGDGNILNSMLTGGLLGAGGAGLGSALGLGAASGAGGAAGGAGGAAGTGSALASQAAAPMATAVNTVTPAMQAAALDAAAVAEGGTTAGMVGAANTGLPANTVLPASMTFTPPAPPAATGLTGKEMLGYGLAGSAALSLLGGRKPTSAGQPPSPGTIRPYEYSASPTTATGEYPNPYVTTEYDSAGLPILDTRERTYFKPTYTALPTYQAAQGGLMAAGGPVERMSAMDQSMGMYPQGMMDKTYYATPSQRPASMEVVRSDYDAPVNPITGVGRQFAEGGDVNDASLGEYIKTQILSNPQTGSGVTYDPVKQMYSQGLPAINQSAMPGGFDPLVVQAYQAQNPNQFRYDAANQRYLSPMPTQDQYSAYLADLQAQQAAAAQQAAPSGDGGGGGGGKAGGLMPYNLGSYSDGGRLLKGPGDGMSDNIPATIGKKQPARLADGEFVVPADVVSHLGNGSTDAGAKRLYAMMDKVRKARTGTKKQGKEIKAEKYIPA